MAAVLHLRRSHCVVATVLLAFGAIQAAPQGPDAIPTPPMRYESYAETLDEEQRSAIHGFIGRVWLPFLRDLTPLDARALATVRGDVRICVPTLSTEAARELSAHRGYLCIGGLRNVSDEVAKSLEGHRGGLYLPDCTSISAVGLRCITRAVDDYLMLRIASIPHGADDALSRFPGWLRLWDIERLEDRSATALAQRPAALEIAVSELSTRAATSLANCRGPVGLTLGRNGSPCVLTRETAAALARLKGLIALEHVTCQPDAEAVAEALAPFSGDLRVYKAFPSTSPGVARHLGLRTRSLTLGLPELERLDHIDCRPNRECNVKVFGPAEYSAAAAAALSQSFGKLTIEDLCRLDVDAAAAFAKHAGPLEISFKQPMPRLDGEVIAALSRHRGSLRLPANVVRDDTIEALLAHVGGLELVGWTVPDDDRPTAKQESRGVSLELFSRLAGYDGPLRLAGELSDAQLLSLETHRGDLALDDLPESEQVVESLLRRSGRLFVTTELSPESAVAARLFASDKLPIGVCTTSRLIGPHAVEIAAALVKRKSSLSMPFLRYVSREALRILESKSDIRLPPLVCIHVVDADGVSCCGDQVVGPEFLHANEANQPPPGLPSWHSWDSQPTPFRSE
jgi:hypothetical protein